MKKLNPTQHTILNTLSDGLWHSGSFLGQQCACSRTAIWKQINQLKAFGLSIMSVPNLGYRLSVPITPIDADKLRAECVKHQLNLPLDIHPFASIHSTNRYLKELPPQNKLMVCLAETQTAGRGRFGRHWHSPFGENIYCSMRMRLDCDLSHLSGLGLVVSLAILEVLRAFTACPDISIKWPNDLLWRDQKLGGTLIEVIAESHGLMDIVIGVGLNVNSLTEQYGIPGKAWCAIRDMTGNITDRTVLLGQLIPNIHQYIIRLTSEGFASFTDLWDQYDYLKNKWITVTHQSSRIQGTAHGVTKYGQLILMDAEGKTHHLSSGDTSLNGID